VPRDLVISTRERLAAALSKRAPRLARVWRAELRARALVPLGQDEAITLIEDLGQLLAVEDERRARAAFAASLRPLGERWRLEGIPLPDAARELVVLLEVLLTPGRLHRGVALASADARRLAMVIGDGVASLSAAHEEAALSEQARFAATLAIAALLHEIDEAVIVIDRAGQRLLVSERARELMNDGADFASEDRSLSNALRGETTHSRLERRNPATGEEQILAARARPIVARAEDPPEGAILVVDDVTRAVRQAEALARVDAERSSLRAQLVRRGRERALGEVAAGAALQLNNELNAMMLTLRLLRTALAGRAAVRHVDALETAAQRSAILTARVQQLASPPVREPMRPIDLNELVIEALDLVRPELTAAASEKSIRVDARFGHLPKVSAHVAELRDLLCTLLVGIRDEVADGTVVRVETSAAGPSGGAALILSHPAGPGTEPPSGDQALYLSAAETSLRQAGGRLEIMKDEHRVQYRFALPAAVEAPAPAPQVSAPAQPGRVLIIDDDPGNRETLSAILSLEGHPVDTAAGWPEALEVFERNPPEAALVDLAMPDLNGWEIARRLRAIRPPLRIALVTGWEIGPSYQEEHPGIIDAVFRKPVDLAALERFLRSPSEPIRRAP
jgi:CheY-like chemotaxis protein